MAEQDPAERLAEALVDEFHGDHGDSLEAAAAAGEVVARFGEALEALRATFAKRVDAGALAGRDPLGEALRALVGRFGPAEQIPLQAAEPPSGARPGAEQASADGAEGAEGAEEVAGPEAARCTRLRAALREARRRVRRLEAENQALREELLSAGEMIETLALDLEKPIPE